MTGGGRENTLTVFNVLLACLIKDRRHKHYYFGAIVWQFYENESLISICMTQITFCISTLTHFFAFQLS